VRLDTYTFEERELHEAIDRLLADEALRARMAAEGEAIRERNGTATAAGLIEALGRRGRTAD
jgi:UDP:flavonoid glycosyltransferase YjiC (YdhE family)